MLTQGGIEGRHYILNEDGTRTSGPEVDDYGWSCWAWGTRSYFQPPVKYKNEEIQEAEKFYNSIMVDYDVFPFAGFSIDNEPYSAENAVILSIEGEYEYSFDLGVYGDKTEVAIDKFIAELKAAGLDELVEYWRGECKAHYDDYMASR